MLSRIKVAGPSLVRVICMLAPNWPVAWGMLLLAMVETS